MAKQVAAAMLEPKNQPICPRCDSKTVIYRKRTNDYLCRRCGKEFNWQEK